MAPNKNFKVQFREKVRRVVQQIPRGKTLSYGEVARLAGNFKAARAVGAMMRANHNPSVPCHRVIAANGSPGGFNRGTKTKIKLLKEEGFDFAASSGRIVKLNIN